MHKKVWHGWKELYGLLTAARVCLLAALCTAQKPEDNEALMEDVVRLCDLGLLMGGQAAASWLEAAAARLTKELAAERGGDGPTCPKRAKLDAGRKEDEDTFELDKVAVKLPAGCRPLGRVEVLTAPDIETFLRLCKLPGKPAVLKDCIDDWPALSDPERRWTPERLARVAGPRTVPVELGTNYTHPGWTQKLMTVGQFVAGHLLARPAGQPGYLAQHQLLDQVPQLGRDVSAPDYCYTGDEDEVDTNVWIGPAGTVSPLHTDPKHNFLCQVSGTKYVVLYPEEETERLYPHQTAMFSNTSQVDLDAADVARFPGLLEARGLHTLLGPGDMLYIPPRTWHYVRSLSASFSVSFWWQ